MGRCVRCEVTWAGDDPCWVCGGPGHGLGWRTVTTPTREQQNPVHLTIRSDGHVEGWENRKPWALYVREELAARLPWLRLETGRAHPGLVWALCLAGLVLAIGARR